MVKYWTLAEFDEEFADGEEFKTMIDNVIKIYDDGNGVKDKHLTHIYIIGIGQDGFEYKADISVCKEKLTKIGTNFEP